MLSLARAALVALVVAGAFPALAQSNYPNKPISWIVPYPAGGNADLRTREIARLLAPMLGQPIVAENRSGAGGNIGTEIIAKAKPDGYTIGVGNFAPLAVNQTMMKSIPFDPLGDFAPIILIERGPLVLMVNNASKIQSLADLIATAKAQPGKLTFASGGLGGSHHLSAELLKSIARIDLVHIPYKGGAPAATDLLAGHVDMMFEQMYMAMPNIKAGKTRALGVTSRKRLAFAPDIPTMEEAGVPGFEVLNWQGVIAPKGTPPEIIQKLNADLNKVLAMAEMRDRITSQGNEVAGGTPQQFDTFIRSENAKWGKLVREANIKAD
jgi:tripartite-type tricarboxylate transporter receptor subunit TctC